jgi:hypothetical protein
MHILVICNYINPHYVDFIQNIRLINNNLGALKNVTYNVPANSSIVISVYYPGVYVFATNHYLTGYRGLSIVYGGNTGNQTQKASINHLINASLLTYTISDVSGSMNNITISNSQAYAVPLSILTLSGQLPVLI